MRHILRIAVPVALLAACGDDPPIFPYADVGLTDTGGSDAGGTDTGGSDTGGTDSGGTDTGGTDTGGTDTGGTDTGGTDTGVPPTSELVDPNCIDGQYTETLPPVDADISTLIAGYSPDNYKDFILDVLEARYPVGAYIVDGALENSSMGDCIDFFLRGNDTPSDIFRQLSVFVHECGHFWDIEEGGFSDATYIFTPDLWLTCSQGDTTSRGGVTFARSLLNGDDYAELRPPCGGGFGGCDSYADIYLDGDPFDGNFDGGDQGFNSVIEEAVQYVNSLATGYAFADQLSGSVSERDGILTFLWWVQRYLRLARLEFPDAHEALLDDPCWREAILTLWGRAWLYLEATDGMGNLSIEGDLILPLVEDPDLLGEIQLVRDAEGCD